MSLVATHYSTYAWGFGPEDSDEHSDVSQPEQKKTI
jgi:hypothetical protein